MYLLVTLGGAALVLVALERLSGGIARALVIFGRTPLFFYVLHLYFGLGGAMALALARGYMLADVAEYMNASPPPSPEFGAGLGDAYVAWILVVAALYPLCRWFAELKRRRKDWWWLSYL